MELIGFFILVVDFDYVVLEIDFDGVRNHEWDCAAGATVQEGVLVHAGVAVEVTAGWAVVCVLVFHLFPA